jgi:hypothetical protein
VSAVPNDQYIRLLDNSVVTSLYAEQDFTCDNFLFVDPGECEVEFKPGVAGATRCRITMLKVIWGVAMELVFLDRNTLQYKDYGYVDKTFEINLDLVIIQKSTFLLNKGVLNAAVGDIVILKGAPAHSLALSNDSRWPRSIRPPSTPSISARSFPSKYRPKLQRRSRFLSGDPAHPSFQIQYRLLAEPIVPFHRERRERRGELTFEADKILSLATVMELITKTYGLRLSSEISHVRGRITASSSASAR